MAGYIPVSLASGSLSPEKQYLWRVPTFEGLKTHYFNFGGKSAELDSHWLVWREEDSH